MVHDAPRAVLANEDVRRLRACAHRRFVVIRGRHLASVLRARASVDIASAVTPKINAEKADARIAPPEGGNDAGARSTSLVSRVLSSRVGHPSARGRSFLYGGRHRPPS